MTAKQKDIYNRQNTAKAYTSMSRWYDLFLYSERKFNKRAIKILDPQPGENILEIGFGTGYNLVKIAGLIGDSGKVFGIDISEGMFNKAKRRFKKNDIQNAELVCDDALNLPFPEKKFDAVFMSFTLELFSEDDISSILKECRRVMKFPGRICITAMAKTSDPNLMTKIYDWFHRNIPKYVDCRPIELKKYLNETGFTISEFAEMKTWGLRIDIAQAKLSDQKN
jgi:ubiquinone/menaquinone biosynthesis C-methylase UbiE